MHETIGLQLIYNLFLQSLVSHFLEYLLRDSHAGQSFPIRILHVSKRQICFSGFLHIGIDQQLLEEVVLYRNQLFYNY